MNITFQDFFTPVGLSVCSNALIFALYVCIRLHDVIPMPGFVFFPMILGDAMLIIGVDFASAGPVYLTSKEVSSQWKMLAGKSQAKRKARSFCPLKVRFGMNFIDELTSLTILDFSVGQTVSLLVMS